MMGFLISFTISYSYLTTIKVIIGTNLAPETKKAPQQVLECQKIKITDEGQEP